MRLFASLTVVALASIATAFVPQQLPLASLGKELEGKDESAIRPSFDWDDMVATLQNHLYAPPAANVSVCWKEVMPHAPPKPPLTHSACR